jgi:hypothetical protein
VLLGQHSGYVTYYYDQPITDDPNNPFGVAFIIYGNSFEGGTLAEPGGVRVSEDGVTWYHLAGQRHYEPGTRYVTDVPLLSGTYGPENGKMTFTGGTAESLLLMSSGDPGFAGGYPDGVNWATPTWRTAPYTQTRRRSGTPKPNRTTRTGRIA